MKKLDLIGSRFGTLIVIREVETSASGQTKLECLCDCGKTSIKQLGNLRSGQTKSCGHLRSIVTGMLKTKHSMYGSPEYKSWSMMLTRCTNKNNHKYLSYGGRGIVVCDKWKEFEGFFSDMGSRPENTSLGRIDNNGNYEPGNCVWESATKQARNKRNTTRYLFNGINATLSEHCETLSIKYSTVKTRIFSYKWSVEKALTTPIYNHLTNQTTTPRNNESWTTHWTQKPQHKPTTSFQRLKRKAAILECLPEPNK